MDRYQQVITTYVIPFADRIKTFSNGEKPSISYGFVKDLMRRQDVVKIIVGNTRVTIDYGANTVVSEKDIITASLDGGAYFEDTIDNIARQAFAEYRRKAILNEPIPLMERSTVQQGQPTHFIAKYT